MSFFLLLVTWINLIDNTFYEVFNTVSQFYTLIKSHVLIYVAIVLRLKFFNNI